MKNHTQNEIQKACQRAIMNLGKPFIYASFPHVTERTVDKWFQPTSKSPRNEDVIGFLENNNCFESKLTKLPKLVHKSPRQINSRRTPEWTPNSEGAFGARGTKGDRGELKGKLLLESLGFDDVIHYPDDWDRQLQGHDLVIRINEIEYPVDVKNNLNQKFDVYIDQKAISKSQATYWLHINDNDPDDWVIYKVTAMREYLKGMTPRRNKNGELFFSVTREKVNSLI